MRAVHLGSFREPGDGTINWWLDGRGSSTDSLVSDDRRRTNWVDYRVSVDMVGSTCDGKTVLGSQLGGQLRLLDTALQGRPAHSHYRRPMGIGFRLRHLGRPRCPFRPCRRASPRHLSIRKLPLPPGSGSVQHLGNRRHRVGPTLAHGSQS